ncbi:hypothetical protein SK128_004030, partial [Halocaridina rubra]
MAMIYVFILTILTGGNWQLPSPKPSNLVSVNDYTRGNVRSLMRPISFERVGMQTYYEN